RSLHQRNQPYVPLRTTRLQRSAARRKKMRSPSSKLALHVSALVAHQTRARRSRRRMFCATRHGNPRNKSHPARALV
ncbi:hypothetical protein SPRG_21546, partial [Saprolegnia parasitica CBS 223.65]